MQTKLFAITTIILVVMHNLAAILNWYDSISWFDSLIHAIAGFWVLNALLLLEKSYPQFIALKGTKIADALTLLGLFALIAILWEFFEFGLDVISLIRNGIPIETQPTRTDVLADLFFGLIGACIGTILAYFRPKKDPSVPSPRT